MICKNCIKADVCEVAKEFENNPVEGMTIEGCEYFKDKSKFIELPCKVGDLVYELVEYKGGGGHTLPLKVVGLHLRDEQNYRGVPRKEYVVVRSIYCGFGFSKHIDLDKIGKTVFLTKEAAEQALRESENK